MAGALAIAATAWIGRDLSELVAQPVVFGLAYLAFAVAVAMRFGAIPFHLWAARLTDVVPETALPILTALAPASLAVVALAWVDASVAPLLVDLGAERAVVLAIAIASIVLAAIAAFVQDDIEHVRRLLDHRRCRRRHPRARGARPGGLGAGPDVDPRVHRRPERVRRVGRGASAQAFWTGRVADLRGWALRSPILAVAFVLVVIASVGFPGLAVFDARASLVDLAVDEPARIPRPPRHAGAARLLRAPARHRPVAAGQAC